MKARSAAKPYLRPIESGMEVKMEQIAGWLKRLIVMVVLAGFIEMLLPDNQLRNVTKLILGLVIMVLMIQPLTNLMNLPSVLAESLFRVPGGGAVAATERVVREGIRMRQQWQMRYNRTNQRYFEENLKKVLSLLEVKLDHVDCDYRDSRLIKVKIVVEPVAGKLIRSNFLRQLDQKVRRAVRLFTGIDEDQVEVRWGE
jgi:stage III sporulation protein AF